MNKCKIYQELVDKYKLEMDSLEKKINQLSNLRLITFLAGVIVPILLYYIGLVYALISLLIFVSTFIYLIIIHQKHIDRLNYVKAYHFLNEKALKRVNYQWNEFADIGEEFISKDHKYTYDLDVFGKFSLFQWLNDTSTPLGRKIFANIFLNPLKSVKEILKRQEAILELADLFNWRQKFMVEGFVNKKTMKNPESLLLWLEEPVSFIKKQSNIILARLVPITTMIMLLFTYIVKILPPYIVLFMLLIQIGAALISSYKYSEKFRKLNSYKDDIFIYGNMLKIIEEADFKSNLLSTFKQKLKDEAMNSAHKQIKSLEKVISMIDARHNMFYLIINILFLWDYQCLIAYERWKIRSDKKIKDWLDIIGWLEALSSMATMKYDNNDWQFPVIDNSHRSIKGKNVGHVLLDNSRVCNDVLLSEGKNVLLITGSNMSGKSTYLRTVGTSLLLAYCGFPVCADEFRCSIMDIYTCMRISDNLETNISSFYAELLRIKSIIESLDNDEPLFFLLDEIFKGTNSVDRHIGAKELIIKLCERNTLGLVSTHDLELGELEKDGKGKIKNMHFREYYQNNAIKFDYKIHNGVCETKNAVYLMELIGLKVKKN